MSFEHLVARQAGVVSLSQAVECGVSAATVQRRARQGSWERLHPAVYLVGGHRPTDEARVRAAALWAGGTAAVSGPAAAYWHGLLDGAPREIEVTVPRRLGPAEHAGVRVRRRDLYPADVSVLRGLRLTALPLTVLETAVVLTDGSAFLDRALQRRTRFPTVYRAYCRNMGRRGSSAAGRLLAAAADRADSAAERLLVRIEVDGWAWHVDPARFQNDRRKQNALVGAGWVVLRFTWHDLDRRPAAVVAEICAALGLA